VVTEFNVAQVHEAVEAAVPDRPCITFRDRHLTYRQVGDRTRQLANALAARGLGARTPRSQLENHESGQSHLALYLHNGNEYLEGMIGAYKARVAPFNVNYRYVAGELAYLLADSAAEAVVYHSAFAPTLAAVRDELPHLRVLLQVADDSGNDLLDGAEWYEDALSSQPTVLDDELVASWSPDDLYILYTGGTTGMPKGVLWRQADIFVGALGGRNQATGEEFESLRAIVEVAATGGAKLMPAPPFMHGAAHWMAFNAFTGGNTVVLPDVVDRFDPEDVLRCVAQFGVNVLLVVGDAFGRPLVEALERGGHDTSSLLALVSGGAALSAGVKERLLAAVPTMMILDGLGASETGAQAYQTTGAGQAATTGTFSPGAGMCILSDDLGEVLGPGHEEVGWLGQRGRVPLGYLGDPDKTTRTFPVIDGIRYAVPGDRARVRADGTLELYGRDSVTINSGGEKIFAEEVEAALAAHPAVFDVVVCGRPSERWGNEVVAIVQLAPGAHASDAELLAEAERHVARYKLPKAILRRERVERSPTGKADYRWARGEAVAAPSADAAPR
jgi:fatty-acyl-CoA synthase